MDDGGHAVLSLLGEHWRKHHFPYAACNGVDLHGNIVGRDLDILVDDALYFPMIRETQIFLEQQGWEVLLHHKSHTCWLFAFGQESGSSVVLEVDFFCKQQWGWVRVLSSPAELDDVFPAGSFDVSPWACFVKNLFIQTLSGNLWKVAKRFKEATALLEANPSIEAKIAARIGPHLASRLVSAFRAKNLEQIKKLAAPVRRQALKRAWLPSRLRWLIPAMATWCQVRFEHRLRCLPVTPILAVVGPDGAGKSTVLEEAKKLLMQRFPFWSIQQRHWRPRLLPNIGYWFGKREDPAQGAVQPRRHAGRLGLLRLVYYSLDFLLGYWIKDRRYRTTITPVIYDRCFWDMAVDPVRFGMSPNRWIKRLGKLLPGPDLIICLNVRPETARLRKGELSNTEVEAQNLAWKKLQEELRVPFHILDADHPVGVLASAVADLYLEEMKKMHRQAQSS